MYLSYDSECNIAYIRFRRKRAKVTTVEVSDELNVDVDTEGRVYGIELLNANAQLGIGKAKELTCVDARSGRKTQLALAG
jgi:uncharacterized protein YuzE